MMVLNHALHIFTFLQLANEGRKQMHSNHDRVDNGVGSSPEVSIPGDINLLVLVVITLQTLQ